MIGEESGEDLYRMINAGYAAALLAFWTSAGALGQTVRSLGSVRSISIGSIDEKDLARQFAGQLNRSKTLRLETAEKADATLDGEAAIWIRGYVSLSPRARTNDAYAEPLYSGYLSVTLKQKSGEVLWSWFAHSEDAGSRGDAARDLVGKILDALGSAIRQSTAATLSSAATANAPPTILRGGGATFPFPIYERWLTSFVQADPSTTITYDPVGSTEGVARFSAGEFDFAGSDLPMPSAKPTRPGRAFATVAGGVVLVYHLPKFSGDLRLTSEAIAGILQGRIARWNDAELRTLNPGRALPDQPIRVAHRSDGSGTTFVLTHYLSEAVHDWKEKMGEGDRVQWRIGEGASGNDGVAAFIESTPYSFGYTEFIFAFRRKLSVASIQNSAGRFAQPDLVSIAAAADGVTDPLPADFDLSLTNIPARNAYPISSFTWLVIPKPEDTDPNKRAALKRFLEWALGPGQRQAMGLGYVPLPKLLLEEEMKAVAALN
jgi:phosphate ABC transporter phosphate-binding protein